MTSEEEGWGAEEIAWGAFKKGAPRTGVAIPWFLWETTYFNDTNDSHVENDLWNSAITFGYRPGTVDPVKGVTGYQYTNGNGVFMYPGTDLSYPANNYNLNGSFASWRLKMMRRGINDADYMAQAWVISSTTTATIVASVASTVLWEKQCQSLADCTYTYGERGFAQTANQYELARETLAKLVATGGTGPAPCTMGVTCFSPNACVAGVCTPPAQIPPTYSNKAIIGHGGLRGGVPIF